MLDEARLGGGRAGRMKVVAKSVTSAADDWEAREGALRMSSGGTDACAAAPEALPRRSSRDIRVPAALPPMMVADASLNLLVIWSAECMSEASWSSCLCRNC